MSTPDYAHIEKNFINWAQSQPDIRAAFVVGSRARTQPPADTWSDLDIIMYTTDPDQYAGRQEWLSELGLVWLAVPNTTFAADPEWVVLYDGGLKVDIVLATAKATDQSRLATSPYGLVLTRGVRLLFDKDEPREDLTLPTAWSESPKPPTQAQFVDTIHTLLLTTTRTVKLLKRQELWQAKFECDSKLKQTMLTLVEWHAQWHQQTGTDVWYDGRFLSRWAAPEIQAALLQTFAAYNADSVWRALLATLALCRQLAHDIALSLDYPYPTLADQRVEAWIKVHRPE